ncbi:MAG: AI-2E family transporter [Lachnospiraceae bacterium]|nr:AI-2E family transporter [Lachnospiraceae bacterium]
MAKEVKTTNEAKKIKENIEAKETEEAKESKSQTASKGKSSKLSLKSLTKSTNRDSYFFWFKIIITLAVVLIAVINFSQLLTIIGNLFSIILPFLIGGVIAFVLNIPMGIIERRLFKKAKKPIWGKLKRPISIVLTLLIVSLFLTLLGFTIIPQAEETIDELKIKIPVLYNDTVEWANGIIKDSPALSGLIPNKDKAINPDIDWQKIVSQISAFLFNGVGGSIISGTFTFAGKVGTAILNTIIAIIFSIYVLAQKERLINQFKRLTSAFCTEKSYHQVAKVLTLLSTDMRGFIAGRCLDALVMGSLTAIAMLIFQFDYVLLISVVVAFTSLIPIVGGFIGCGAGALLFLIESPSETIGFIILFLVVFQIDCNFIYPYIVGSTVGLPSMWVLAAITIGGSLFGVAGMLFFVPVMSTLYTLTKEFVNNRNKTKPWAEKPLYPEQD